MLENLEEEDKTYNPQKNYMGITSKLLFECDTCKSLFKTQETAIEHEKCCSYKVSSCKCETCIHLESSYGNTSCSIWSVEKTYDYWDNNLKCPFHKPKVFDSTNLKDK